MEMDVPCENLPDAVFAHQNRYLSVVDQIARDMRKTI